MENRQQQEFERLMKEFQAAQERNDADQIESLTARCLELAAEFHEQNPSEHLRLCEQASEHETAARWDEAESCYRQALAIAETEGEPALICKGHQDLSNLFVMRGMAESALKEAEAAVAAMKEGEMHPLRAAAFGQLFHCQMMNGHYVEAAATAEKALCFVPAEKLYELSRVKALLMRARCRLQTGEISAGDPDLEEAWQILAPKAEAKTLAGFQGGLAAWWDIKSGIMTRAGDAAGAAQAMGKAVEFRRNLSELPQLDGPMKHLGLAKALQKHVVALRAAGSAEASIGAFEESQRIQEKYGFSLPMK
jgi:tetratricopeptide (TPR) repeat protein